MPTRAVRMNEVAGRGWRCRMLLRLTAVAVIGVLMCTSAPISAAESAGTTTQQVNPPTPATDTAALAPVRTPGDETLTARLGPAPQRPAPTAKRRSRRHHLWLWHLVPGSGGPLSWLLLVPYLIVGLGLAAILIFVRRRRTKASTAVNFDVTQARNFDAPSHAILDAPTGIHPVDDRLHRLQDLHAAGMLSDDEFETQRLRIIGT
jgi:hypothetical protein